MYIYLYIKELSKCCPIYKLCSCATTNHSTVAMFCPFCCILGKARKVIKLFPLRTLLALFSISVVGKKKGYGSGFESRPRQVARAEYMGRTRGRNLVGPGHIINGYGPVPRTRPGPDTQDGLAFCESSAVHWPDGGRVDLCRSNGIWPAACSFSQCQ